MRILILCSINKYGHINSFITEQVEAVATLGKGAEFEYFTITQRGIKGYLAAWPALRAKIAAYKPHIIHAHYGMCGLLANFQRAVPVLTTYHGSDIYELKPYATASLWAIFLSKRNIFVSERLAKKSLIRIKYDIVPCGVDLNTFIPTDKTTARDQLGLSHHKKYVLFSSNFDEKVKNYPLALGAVELLQQKGLDIVLLEYKGYSRQQANLLFNAVDCVLVSSHRESGPLVIKEAMAVNTAAVSVDVGDVSQVTRHVKGYYISNHDKNSLALMISKALDNKTIEARQHITQRGLDNTSIAQRLLNIYTALLKK